MKKFAIVVLGLTFIWTNQAFPMEEKDDQKDNGVISIANSNNEEVEPEKGCTCCPKIERVSDLCSLCSCFPCLVLLWCARLVQ